MSLTFDDGTFYPHRDGGADAAAAAPGRRHRLDAREPVLQHPSTPSSPSSAFGLVLLIVPPLVRFMFIDAMWTGQNREACLGPERGRLLALHPGQVRPAHLRLLSDRPSAGASDIVFAPGAILLVPLLVLTWPFKRLNAFLFFGDLPDRRLHPAHRRQHQRCRPSCSSTSACCIRCSATSMVVGVNLVFWADYVLTALIVMAAIGGVIGLIGGDGRAAARSAMWIFLAFGLARARLGHRFRPALCRDAAMGRPAGDAGDRGDRHRRLAAAGHPAGAGPALADADRAAAVRWSSSSSGAACR